MYRVVWAGARNQPRSRLWGAGLMRPRRDRTLRARRDIGLRQASMRSRGGLSMARSSSFGPKHPVGMGAAVVCFSRRPHLPPDGDQPSSQPGLASMAEGP